MEDSFWVPPQISFLIALFHSIPTALFVSSLASGLILEHEGAIMVVVAELYKYIQ